jgi:hypothetical protein
MASPPKWIDFFNKFRLEHIEKYGVDIDRQWGADPDSWASKLAIDKEYLDALDKYNKDNGTDIAPEEDVLGMKQTTSFVPKGPKSGGILGWIAPGIGDILEGRTWGASRSDFLNGVFSDNTFASQVFPSLIDPVGSGNTDIANEWSKGGSFVDRFSNTFDRLADPTNSVNYSLESGGEQLPEDVRNAMPGVLATIGTVIYPVAGTALGYGIGSHLAGKNSTESLTGAGTAATAAWAGGQAFGSGGQVGTGDFDPVTGQEIMSSTNTAYGPGWVNYRVGTGDFDPVTGEEIMATPEEAYGSGYSTGGSKTKEAVEKLGKKYAKELALKALGGSGEGDSGFSGLKGPFFNDELSVEEDALDKILKMTGETGDIKTAFEAAEKFEENAFKFAELEKEIARVSGDPDFKDIEPELRATAIEAVKQGMSPKEATAMAFEKAKKEREHSDFLREYLMRKKLESAGLDKKGVAA